MDAGSRQVGPVPTVAGPRTGDALLVVDLQHDFLPGGALGIARGDAVLPVANRLIADFQARGLPVVLSRDWHPPDHCSFEAQGGPWPVHCVAGSHGAAFTPVLKMPGDAIIISKATRADQEAYSAFDGTGLLDQLRERGVRRVWLCGLATDYCVRATTLDARRAGFEAVVVEDGICAVDVNPGDGARALAELRAAGAALLRSSDLPALVA
jgi:nicotinamidase/pyrazinamidase